MYTCYICNQDFGYLIFEYNSLVCENCSIRKNIKNCHELDAVMPPAEETEEEFENVEGSDAEQLLALMEEIDNPRIREDFLELAHQYIQGIEKEEN